MRGRKPGRIDLKPKDKTFLLRLLQDGQTPLKVARRAQVLLSRADSKQRVVVIGKKVEQAASTIWRICKRYRQQGLEAALYDGSRSGRPPVFFQQGASPDRRTELSRS